MIDISHIKDCIEDSLFQLILHVDDNKDTLIIKSLQELKSCFSPQEEIIEFALNECDLLPILEDCLTPGSKHSFRNISIFSLSVDILYIVHNYCFDDLYYRNLVDKIVHIYTILSKANNVELGRVKTLQLKWRFPTEHEA